MPNYHLPPSFDTNRPFLLFWDKDAQEWTAGPPRGQDTGERRVEDGFPKQGQAHEIPVSPEVGQCFFHIGWGLPMWWTGMQWVNAIGIAFSSEDLENPPQPE